MKKQLKKTKKKLSKCKKELQETRETLEGVDAIAEAYKKKYQQAQTALDNLKSALEHKDTIEWYERRVIELEEVIASGVSTKTSYGQMAAQNRLLSKMVRELRAQCAYMLPNINPHLSQKRFK